MSAKDKRLTQLVHDWLYLLGKATTPAKRRATDKKITLLEDAILIFQLHNPTARVKWE